MFFRVNQVDQMKIDSKQYQCPNKIYLENVFFFGDGCK